MNCEFSNPVNYLGQEPLEGECWNFKTLICQDEKFTLIQNTEEPPSEFYLQKTLSYGDLILIIYVTIFSIVLLTIGIFKFTFKK